MPKETKATKAETLMRTEEIYGLLLRNKTRKEILAFVEQQTDWNIRTRQVDNYIQKATIFIEDAFASTKLQTAISVWGKSSLGRRSKLANGRGS